MTSSVKVTDRCAGVSLRATEKNGDCTERRPLNFLVVKSYKRREVDCPRFFRALSLRTASRFYSSRKPMSTAGAECVIAPADTESTPLSA